MDRPSMDEHRRIALVTGGSRGLGAATAEALASCGYDVVLTYRDKEKRAEDILSRIGAQGHRAMALASDMTRPGDQQRLVAELARWGNSRLDVLILNAAGGLEAERLAEDQDYPRLINCDAQVSLVERMLPLMPAGSTVVFVTSHWSHLYGQIHQLPWYKAVAATKYAGEMALRAMRQTMEQAGVRLLVASADIIEGTFMTRRLKRAEPVVIQSREALLGRLPTAHEVGEAIAHAASDPALVSGYTVVIGGSLQSVIDSFSVRQ